MTEHTNLKLFTTPSTFVRADLPPTVTPYKKVVGVQVGREESWTRDAAASQELSYDVPPVFGHRLLWYFRRYLSEARVPANPDTSRNCLHFGMWMSRGIAYATRREASNVVINEARYTPPLTMPSQPGELSVIRPTFDLPQEPVLHALVALTSADTANDKSLVDSHIQIMTRGGDMGVSSAHDAVAYRETDAYRSKIAPAYFATDPRSWAVGHYSVSASLRPDYL